MNDNTESCIVFAARYAHKRNTGAALLVVSFAKENWDDLELYTREQLIKESEEAIYNLDTWESLRKFAKEKNNNK